MSRRGALAAAFAAAVGSSWIGRAATAAVRPAVGKTPAFRLPGTAGTCTRTIAKGAVAHDFTVVQGAYTLTQSLRAAPDGSASSVMAVTRSGEPLYTIDAKRSAAGVGSATITFAAALGGARVVTATTAAGGSAQGVADGREFAAGQLPKSINDIRFLDNRPAQAPTVDAKLAADLAGLRPLARAAIADCASAKSSQRPADRKLVKDSSYLRAGANEDGYTYLPGETANGTGCTDCYNNCETIYQDTLPGWGDVLVCAPCAAAQAAAALVVYGGCCGVCNLPDGGCYPVPCGGPWISCFSGDTCFNGGICCDGPNIVCNGACCSDGITKCAADGTCGCGDYHACGSFCCQPSDRCCEGTTCCPPGNKCCGATCVPEGVACCGSSSCQQGETCVDGPKGKTCCVGKLNSAGDCCGLNYPCGSTCCDASAAVCHNGKCCPTGQVCGSVCCPSGSSCQDAKTGTCGAVCPPGIASCSGKCCPAAADSFGQIVCCTPVQGDRYPYNNTAYGCHHAYACVAPLK